LWAHRISRLMLQKLLLLWAHRIIRGRFTRWGESRRI
jgi:hypothetical protein